MESVCVYLVPVNINRRAGCAYCMNELCELCESVCIHVNSLNDLRR